MKRKYGLFYMGNDIVIPPYVIYGMIPESKSVTDYLKYKPEVGMSIIVNEKKFHATTKPFLYYLKQYYETGESSIGMMFVEIHYPKELRWGAGKVIFNETV